MSTRPAHPQGSEAERAAARWTVRLLAKRSGASAGDLATVLAALDLDDPVAVPIPASAALTNAWVT